MLKLKELELDKSYSNTTYDNIDSHRLFKNIDNIKNSQNSVENESIKYKKTNIAKKEKENYITELINEIIKQKNIK